MGEKKSIKISLKTYLISMFLMLLVIGILLGYILQTGEQINKEITTQNDNKNVGETVILENEDKEELENNIVENDTETETKNESERKTAKELLTGKKGLKEEFTEEEIKSALENYLNIFHGYGAQEQLLNSLDLMSYEDSEKYTQDEENYKITDIPYTEFEKKIKQYTTIENFEKLINKKDEVVKPHFKNVNGNLAYFNGGWTGTEYVVNSVTIKGDYSDTRCVANYYITEGEFVSEETTLEFDVENNNGNCIISNCYFE